MPCPFDCNDRGICVKDVFCVCESGYSGSITVGNYTLPTCTKTYEDEFPVAFRIQRWAFFAASATCLLLWLVLLPLVIKRRRETVVAPGKEQLEAIQLRLIAQNFDILTVMSFILLFVIEVLKWGANPYGYNKNVNYSAFIFLRDYGYIQGFTYQSAILFAWHCFNRASLRSIKREEMLSKINRDNKKYKGEDITVEGMLDSAGRFTALKWVWLAIWLTVVGGQILMSSLHVAGRFSYFNYVLFFNSFMCFVHFCMIPMPWYLVSQMMKILPDALRPQLQVTIKKLTILFIIIFLNLFLNFVLGAGLKDWRTSIWTSPILFAGEFGATGIALSIFIQPIVLGKYYNWKSARTTSLSHGNDIELSRGTARTGSEDFSHSSIRTEDITL